MYFDFRTWWRLVTLSAQESSPRRRLRLYYKLLLKVPLVAVFNALCFFLDPILFPALRRTAIHQPVFVIGHARSGTTLLHRLMHADSERFSAFMYWELFAPSLLQKKVVRWVARGDAAYLGGRLARRVRAHEARVFRASNHIHEMGYTLPEEDDFLLTYSCASGYWSVQLPYMDQLDFFHVDQRPAKARRRLMNYYRECVRRQLCMNGGGKIHLSKNPTFCGRVESLIECFPDARFVLPYRNPLETIPSLLKLMKFSWKARHFDETRMRRSLAVMAGISFESYTLPLEVLARHPQVRRSIVDYRELVANPRATIEQVYADLGMQVSANYATVLEQEQARAKAGAHETRHRYSLDEFGLDAADIRTRLGELFERFGWDADNPAA